MSIMLFATLYSYKYFKSVVLFYIDSIFNLILKMLIDFTSF
uniref:Uncharacterized protein n=1 Tax=Carnobacterium maltaromaticum TaxID=2751 RepID=A0A1Z5AYV7_CARML|nr:protein of unknown function [Carnobacterium maltaromaticum]